MSISCQRRTAIAYHGLHLVPQTSMKVNSGVVPSSFVYRIAAAGAALFLAMTVC